MKKYVYIFTRQDMSPEQIAVQSAHATFKLGTQMGSLSQKTSSDYSNPDETYFTLVGVRNEEALAAVAMILEEFDFVYEKFFEPDLPGVTSIAVYPVDEDKRGPLMAFNLMKIGRQGHSVEEIMEIYNAA